MGYTHEAFKKNAKLDDITGRVDDSGEGKWMVQEALEFGVSLPVITTSLFTRFKSRDEENLPKKSLQQCGVNSGMRCIRNNEKDVIISILVLRAI